MFEVWYIISAVILGRAMRNNGEPCLSPNDVCFIEIWWMYRVIVMFGGRLNVALFSNRCRLSLVIQRSVNNFGLIILSLIILDFKSLRNARL